MENKRIDGYQRKRERGKERENGERREWRLKNTKIERTDERREDRRDEKRQEARDKGESKRYIETRGESRQWR